MTYNNPARALQRMLIRVEYDGTGLVGWQRQDNGPSVQAILEQAAEKLTTQPTPVQGSGRTDAGVCMQLDKLPTLMCPPTLQRQMSCVV